MDFHDKEIKRLSRDQVMRLCYRDLAYFGKVFFPEFFSRPFDLIHRDIFDAIQADSQRVCVAAPRGIGKTTISNLLYPAWAAFFHKAHFIMPVSATSDLAQMLSENLKSAILSNKAVKALIGDVTATDVETDTGYKDRSAFSQKGWTLRIGSRVVFICPRGGGQQVRGLNYRGKRPDLIIVDDLDDPRYIQSEDQRMKLKQWFRASLVNTVDGGSKDWRIINVGTVQHEDSHLQHLLENKRWVSTRLELCDDHFKSNAPHYKNDEECKDLYEEYKEEGMLDDFFREFRNIPAATGVDAVFPDSFFQNYDPIDLEDKFDTDPSFENVLLVDIAKTAKPNSAESALVTVAVNMKTNGIYVRDIEHGRWHYDEILDKMIAACKRANIRTLGAEITGLNEFATYPIENALSQSGLDRQVEFIPLHARGGVEGEKGKISRIRSLQPFYRKGLVYHNPACGAVLEQQLRAFPRSRMWDVMDAFAYVIEIMNTGMRFMLPVDYDDSPLYDAAEISDDFERDMRNLDKHNLPPIKYGEYAYA